VLWIKGINFGSRAYRVSVEFETVAGMLPGAPVRYRGVQVGRIIEIRAGSNAAEAVIEIDSNDLVIPTESMIEANQIGLIGETSIDIYPDSDTVLSETALAMNPLSSDCNSSLILCNGDRLQGSVGVSYDTLIRATVDIADLFTESGFFEEIRTLTRNSADAAASVADLGRQMTSLTATLENELDSLTASAVATTNAVGEAATQLGLTASQVNGLIDSNRTTLISTLDNINQASYQLQTIMSQLQPVLTDGELLNNLQTLSANAAAASDNLRAVTESVGSPENIVLLQQTLESARATFQNAQKITADLDELTGDPAFRQNVRDLIEGLSGLVSSTQQLEQQTELAQVLTPLSDDVAVNEPPVLSFTNSPEVEAPSASTVSTVRSPYESADLRILGDETGIRLPRYGEPR
jgi:phospholipid/cholesterol/gamma-HCH transport system substrate-binding protein